MSPLPMGTEGVGMNEEVGELCRGNTAGSREPCWVGKVTGRLPKVCEACAPLESGFLASSILTLSLSLSGWEGSLEMTESHLGLHRCVLGLRVY